MKTSDFPRSGTRLAPFHPGGSQRPLARALIALGIVLTLHSWDTIQAAQLTLENQTCRLTAEADGTLVILPKEGGDEFRFRPEFTALVQTGTLAATGGKLPQPVYNLVGWQLEKGKKIFDVFQIGQSVSLKNPEVVLSRESIRWKFSNEILDLTAHITLPAGKADPVINYTFIAKKAAFYSVAYSGAPAASLEEVVELWQPLIWDGRRLPAQAFLTPDDMCSIPGCLVQTRQGTVGVLADPTQFPFEMPSALNRRFGVLVRNADGLAQPLVFAPFPGAKNSLFQPGDSAELTLRLVAKPAPLSATFEYVARAICNFRDMRENTLTTLNQTLDNIIDYTLSPNGQFNPANRAFNYPDAAGTVKNVSALYPLTLGVVLDNETLFRTQGIPILEYLLSREKFLFALEEKAASSQTPSRKLAGPAMPVSELAALHRITGGASPVFLESARALHGKDRMLNMEWISRGNSWENDLWLYRATGEKRFLESAKAKADQYLAERVNIQPLDFQEVGPGTFFDYMIPLWKQLDELYRETGDKKYLDAAHSGARRYAQFIWFYPSVPDAEIAVNKTGFSPRRASREPGLIPVPPEKVPAWRVAEQGLLAEGNGTAGRLGILLATHAPFFRRLAQETNDPFLRDISRWAVVGRYANFPGYHINTEYSTVQEKFEFPYYPFPDLAKTTSFHFNHTLPMAGMILDYLFSEAFDRSAQAIDFPTQFAEGYAYMGMLVYGAPGRFYDIEKVRPWMPQALVGTNSVQVNYIAGHSDDTFCLALMNQSAKPLDEVTLQLDGRRFENAAQGTFKARVWVDNKLQDQPLIFENGKAKVSFPAGGMVAVAVKGLKAIPVFQNKVAQPSAPVGLPRHITLKSPIGEPVEAMVLSFGPELTWLYAYQSGEKGDAKSLTLNVKTDSQSRTLTDGTFPFEFSLPLKGTDTSLELSLEAGGTDGTKLHSEKAILKL